MRHSWLILLSFLLVAAWNCAAEKHEIQQSAIYTPIVDGEYVTIQDGHFTYRGKRIKLWGTNYCSTVKRGGADLVLDFDRLAFMNFNGIRTNLSDPMFRPREADTSDTIQNPVKGDDSQLDRMDYAIALGKERGMFFWLEFHQSRKFQPNDYALAPMDDGMTQEEWNEVVRDFGDITEFVYLSRRAEEVLKRYAFNLLDRVNPYTGKRYAEEEAIACYQIFNENSAASWLLTLPQEGAVSRLVTRRWNDFLRERYGDEEALRQAWGALGEGESLAAGTVKYGPLPGGKMVADAGYQYTLVSDPVEIDSIETKRREDVMRFCYEMYRGFNQRFTDYLRTLAPAGVGINVVPITSTCRYGEDLMMYAAADLVSDFTALGSYSFAPRPWAKDKNDPFFPWEVRVNAPPLIENPIDCFKVAGKPYMIYEVNDYRPNPYRVEFPVRVAINSLLRGGDGVFWFNWDDDGHLPNMHTDKDYATAGLPMAYPGYPNACLIMCTDEAMLQAVKAAGELFRCAEIEPLPAPERMTIGADVLLDMDQRLISDALMSRLYPRAWTDGIELTYDLAKPSQWIEPAQLQQEFLQYDNGIRLDWANSRGHFEVNRANAKLWVGFLPKEIQLGEVKISDFSEDYALIALVARDGEALPEAQEILLTVAVDGNNQGFAVDWEKFELPWSDGLAQAIVSSGRGPALVTRLGCKLEAPWLVGRTVERYDFERNCYAREISDGSIKVGTDEKMFFCRIVQD